MSDKQSEQAAFELWARTDSPLRHDELRAAWFAWQERARRASQAPSEGADRATGIGTALITLALEAGELSEGQVSKLLGLDRVAVRRLRDDGVAAGLAIAEKMDAAIAAEAGAKEPKHG